MTAAAKKRVAILGGGMAALTAALQLSEGNWRDKFESITIYQLGWRLGGKGATGRVDKENRILEHGLHVWLGFYDNAFRLIQKVYDDAKRPANSPIPTWQAAFAGQDYVGVMDHHNGQWTPWLFWIPPNDLTPGQGAVPSLGESMKRWIHWMKATWDDLDLPDKEQKARLSTKLADLEDRIVEPAYTSDAKAVLEQVSAVSGTYSTDGGAQVIDQRKWSLLVETGATILHGLVAEWIWSYAGLEKLEVIDFAAWLKKYNTRPGFADLAQNPLIRAMYDFAFAYENGDVTRPNFSTAPALRTIFRMCLTYKGSIFYKMKAGMGDTIFAPIYEALRNRGVDIKFFHKVNSLELSADRKRVERIHIGLQATVKNSPYQPLKPVAVGGTQPLPCWPNQPLYDQLVEGDKLRACGADLESFWTTWQDVKEVSLEAGKDFDAIVFGISMGSIPFVCADLFDASEAWANMVDNVATVGTLALQLWLKRDIQQLGWTQHSPIVDAWVEPLDTWADMTDIMRFESWTGSKPGSLAYFCGPLEGGLAGQGDPGFPSRALGAVEIVVDKMTASDIQTLWPSAGSRGLPADDIMAKYVRANINPSERYVLSPADTARFRLAADKSGFANLVLAGDWILNGYNAGCIEASVWSGIQAANAILGLPLDQGIAGR